MKQQEAIQYNISLRKNAPLKIIYMDLVFYFFFFLSFWLFLFLGDQH